MAISFESGIEKLRGFMGRSGDEAYFANAADPLHAAFRAKAAVHAGPMGLPLLWKLARRKAEDLSMTPRTEPGLAYIHIPFCETRCLYCMFYQNHFEDEAARHYIDLLVRELHLWARRPIQQSAPIEALYIGGGTPSALPPSDISRLMAAVRETLPLSADCEVTLEGRIHDMTSERLDAAARSGVNRISLGVQTFNDQIRHTMQRIDGRDSIVKTLERMRAYPEFALVIDLLYGFPMQGPEVWQEDVRTALSLPLDGIDCYQLNLFEKSPLARQIRAGLLPPAATLAEAADCYDTMVRLAGEDARWTQISNTHWRRTEKERNRYNATAKGPCDCLAFGCGAGGKVGGHTFMQERKLKAWEAQVSQGEKPVMVLMKPSAHWHMLRTVAHAVENGPFSLREIGSAFGMDIDGLARPLTNQWIEAGLLTREGDLLTPTTAGRFWHVTMAQFLVNAISKKIPDAEEGNVTLGYGVPEKK